MGSPQSVIDRPHRVLMSEGVGILIAGFAPVSQICPRLGEIERSFSVARNLLQSGFQTGSGTRIVSQLELYLADFEIDTRQSGIQMACFLQPCEALVAGLKRRAQIFTVFLTDLRISRRDASSLRNRLAGAVQIGCHEIRLCKIEQRLDLCWPDAETGFVVLDCLRPVMLPEKHHAQLVP